MENIKNKLPKKLTVFFGNDGLSMSEANYIANLIKEMNKTIKSEIEQVKSAKESFLYDGETITRDSVKIDLKEKCVEEGELYALSSWLREGIKSKEELLDYVKNINKDDELIRFFDLELPKTPEELGVNPPVMKPIVSPKNYTEDDIIGEMNIAERAEYYSLEAKAAHIGKKIHDNGKISKLREEILNFQDFKVETYNCNGGTKDCIVKREKKYTNTEIDETFFFLQNKHREYEKKLNFYKARIKNDLSDKNAKEMARYSKEYNDAKKEYDNKTLEYNSAYINFKNTFNSLLNEASEKRVKLLNDISKWKIVIPNMHKENVDKILALTASE